MYRKYIARVEQLCNNVSTAVGWGLDSRDHYLMRDVEQLLQTHRELLAASNAAGQALSEPAPVPFQPNVPSDPWAIGLPSDTRGIPGNDFFQFSMATTPTSASNSPDNNDPNFFWTGPSTA